MFNFKKKLLVYIIAGEPSGDKIGASLMREILNKTNNNVDFIGIGGKFMSKHNFRSLFPMEELSLMGIMEVIPYIPRIFRRISQTVDSIKKQKPDAVITIDAPDFNFRIAKRLKNTRIPVFHFSCPTVWAWRKNRANKLSNIIEHLFAFFPFEPEYFNNLPCTFIGHPFTELKIDKVNKLTFRKKHNIPKNKTLLCLLPGSRKKEILRHFPIFIDTLKQLISNNPNLYIVIPTVHSLFDLINSYNLPSNTLIVKEEIEKYQAMRASDIALAASGSVSLELAIAGVPMVIAYKVNVFTALLARILVKTPYICLINIILKSLVVSECVQRECNANKLTTEVENLLYDKKVYSLQKKKLLKTVKLLSNFHKKPNDLATEIILKKIQSSKG